jgi:hypothetical protein
MVIAGEEFCSLGIPVFLVASFEAHYLFGVPWGIRCQNSFLLGGSWWAPGYAAGLV